MELYYIKVVEDTPGTTELETFKSREDAEARARELRQANPTKIYEVSRMTAQPVSGSGL